MAKEVRLFTLALNSSNCSTFYTVRITKDEEKCFMQMNGFQWHKKECYELSCSPKEERWGWNSYVKFLRSFFVMNLIENYFSAVIDT